VAPAGLRLPNTTQALLASKNGSPVSLGTGWARPHVAMLVFSAPAGDAGVVSSAVAVDDIVGPAGTRICFKDRMDVSYAIIDNAAAGGVPATAHYIRVVDSGQSGHDAVTQAEVMGFFEQWDATACTGSRAPTLTCPVYKWYVPRLISTLLPRSQCFQMFFEFFVFIYIVSSDTTSKFLFGPPNGVGLFEKYFPSYEKER
jgi:hypothetical protein